MTAAPPVADPLPTALRIARPAGPRPGRVRRGLRAAGLAAGWLFGVAALVVGLATLSAVPVAQFLVLGYLLEAAGRMARTGRLAGGFVGVRTAARVGGVVAGVWVLLLPVRFVADLAHSAAVVHPGSSVAAGWRLGLLVLTVLTAAHITGACGRGGRLRHFANPLSAVWLARRLLRGGFYAPARDAVWDGLVALRLPHYLVLGLKGFVVGLAWLAVPAALLTAARNPGPGAGLLGLVGGLLLAWVAVLLPFLQVRVGETGRLRAGFELRTVRWQFARAPWAFATAALVAVLAAVPLYLLKIEAVPRDAAWLPGLLFVGFALPARLLAGWAVGRAARRDEPRHWLACWVGRVPLVPAGLAYALVVFLARYTDWAGAAGAFAQHAFLLPVPTVGV